MYISPENTDRYGSKPLPYPSDTQCKPLKQTANRMVAIVGFIPPRRTLRQKARGNKSKTLPKPLKTIEKTPKTKQKKHCSHHQNQKKKLGFCRSPRFWTPLSKPGQASGSGLCHLSSTHHARHGGDGPVATPAFVKKSRRRFGKTSLAGFMLFL